MNTLNIPGSQSVPTVNGDWERGSLAISGDSYPENSFDVFHPVIEWVERYLAEGRPLALELRLLYLNTSSVRALMDILDMLEDAYGRGAKVSVNWHYDRRNERVAELAEEFREDCTFPFMIVPHD
jgi:hypothetical protein